MVGYCRCEKCQKVEPPSASQSHAGFEILKFRVKGSRNASLPARRQPHTPPTPEADA